MANLAEGPFPDDACGQDCKQIESLYSNYGLRERQQQKQSKAFCFASNSETIKPIKPIKTANPHCRSFSFSTPPKNRSTCARQDRNPKLFENFSYVADKFCRHSKYSFLCPPSLPRPETCLLPTQDIVLAVLIFPQDPRHSLFCFCVRSKSLCCSLRSPSPILTRHKISIPAPKISG